MGDTGETPEDKAINLRVTTTNIAFHAAASTVAWMDVTARSEEKDKLAELVSASPEAAKQAIQDLEKNRGLYPGADIRLAAAEIRGLLKRSARQEGIAADSAILKHAQAMDVFAYNTMGSATDDETGRVRELVTANRDAARQAVDAIAKNSRAFDGVDAKGADATYEIQQDLGYKEQPPRTLAQIQQDIKEQAQNDLTSASAWLKSGKPSAEAAPHPLSAGEEVTAANIARHAAAATVAYNPSREGEGERLKELLDTLPAPESAAVAKKAIRDLEKNHSLYEGADIQSAVAKIQTFITSTSGRDPDKASTLTYLNIADEAVAMTNYENNGMWPAREDRAARLRELVTANPDAAREAVKQLESGPPDLYEGGNIKKAVAEIKKDLSRNGQSLSGAAPEAADPSALQQPTAATPGQGGKEKPGAEITR